jgi:hypothetical protein
MAMASRRSRFLALLALGVIPGIGLGTGVGWSVAQMTNAVALGANTFSTAPSFDTVAPTVSATVIAKAAGTGQYYASFIKQAGTYYVYANATDGGVVPSGIATIKADVSAITTGSTAISLVAGSYTVEGVTYGYRTASLTANAGLTAGSKSYTLTSTDNNGNSRLQSGFTVTVDNTVPTGSDIQCVNGGATVGTIELGDVCTFTFSEVIDPESILAGWTGVSTNVVVQWTNSAANDSFTIWNGANTTQLNLGSVNTHGDYVTGAVTAGASGTPSTMVLNTASNTITVTFGTITGTTKNDTKKNTTAWTPSAAAFDRAGNAMPTTVVNEGGVSDNDF